MTRAASEPATPGDDLDRLLRAYFRAELPAPWPPFQPPAKARLLPFRGKSPSALPAWTSRAALVAAAAALLLAALALMPRPTTGTTEPAGVRTIGPSIADPKGTPRGPGSTAPGKLTPEKKVKSSMHLEQGDDGRTGFKITVEELTPDR